MVPVAVFLLAGLFGTAGLAKLKRRLAFRVILAQLLGPSVARPLATLIPTAELGLALLLLSGLAPRTSAALAVLLLSAFSLALLQMRRAHTSMDCGCFGESRESAGPTSGLIRNVALLALSVVVLLDPSAAVVPDAEAHELLVASTIAAAATCLWLLGSALLTHRDILFLPRASS